MVDGAAYQSAGEQDRSQGVFRLYHGNLRLGAMDFAGAITHFNASEGHFEDAEEDFDNATVLGYYEAYEDYEDAEAILLPLITF